MQMYSMKYPRLCIAILAASTALLAQQPQQPDPAGQVDEPGRAVARLGIVNGDVSVKRGDSSDWQAAAINAPLMSGDQIAVTAGGRAEVELDSSHFLRISGDTEVRLADLDNGHYQVQLSHGTVTWRVLRQTQIPAEVDTPLVGVHPGPQSTVRVEVDTDGTSHITVRHGEADVSTDKGSEKVAENTTMDVRGSISDPEFQEVAAAARDEWDGWNDQRDNYLLRAQSQRYVTSDVSGVEDLDPYGRWNYDPAYGWVWQPTVAASWAPYQNGQWVWEDYYGWTWVDYAPWGWAPFHYGYWYNRVGFGWSWYPGSRIGHVWWRPAMVGFFGWGGGGFGIGVGFGFGNVGWIPLAPHEVFRPWYGRGGFGGGAVLNAGVVRNANIIGTFRNASAVGGVTAVSAADFQRGNFRNTVAVDRATLSQASLVRGTVPMTPTSQNLRFSNRTASVQSPRVAMGAANQRFYGSSTARRTPFVQQQSTVRTAVGASPSQSSMAAPSRGGVNQSAGWGRFEGSPAGRGTPQANPSPSTRQFQVSPSIIRQRDASPAPAPRSAPAPQRGGYSAPAPAPRSAPAGGGNRGGGSSRGSGGGRH